MMPPASQFPPWPTVAHIPIRSFAPQVQTSPWIPGCPNAPPVPWILNTRHLDEAFVPAPQDCVKFRISDPDILPQDPTGVLILNGLSAWHADCYHVLITERIAP
jgi:hypothetical protein